MSGTGVKRKSNDAAVLPVPKKPHPFFTGKLKSSGTFLKSPETLIHFVHLDPFSSLPLPAASTSEASSSINGASASASNAPTAPAPAPKHKVPVIFYDLDGTLIKPKSGASFPKNRDDFMWWHNSVPGQLAKEHAEGKHLIVISNQGDERPKVREEWRAKLRLFADKMPPNVPIRILAALSKIDQFRKPMVGMYETVASLYASHGLEIDLEKSLFVGDAAGRPPGGGKRKDHSDTDYKFALNIGVRFLTPEEHFLGESQRAYPRPPVGFKPSKLAHLANLPPIVPSHTPISRSEEGIVEMVIFVGPPASGKTSFFRRYFMGHYEHINQDTLGSRDKCLKAAEGCLISGKSVVVDNTNRNKPTRAYWIALAGRLHVPIRIFHFLCPLELAKHNNVYRACYAPKDEPHRTLLPGIAFSSYHNDFETPTLDEGFDELRSVNFVFEGSAEQRRKWDMYMLETK